MNGSVEDEIEDLEKTSATDQPEEPWCSTCHQFTDYRRKWDTINRSDLDGRSYSENIEVPHCIDCGNPMLLLSTAKKLVWSVYTLSVLAWIVGLLFVGTLFGFNLQTILVFLIFTGFCFLCSRLPQKSRLLLRSRMQAKKEQGLRELLQKL